MTELEQRFNQIEWFIDLRDSIEAGDIETAIAAIDAAIKLIKREIGAA